MKILLLNEHQGIASQNLIHSFSEKLKTFHWTGKKFYRLDFLPRTKEEESSYKHESEALTLLQDGYYDFVIYSEGSSYIYLSSHLKTKKVFLDSSDLSRIPRSYWENSDLYFKAQLPKKDIVVKNNNEEGYLVDSYLYDKLYPFCLGTSFKFNVNSYNNNNCNYDLFFLGSAWPRKRVEIISQIKNHPEINFFGGLFNRSDLEFNCVFPDSLACKKMSPEDHLYAMLSSKMCLNIEGNGKNCFRQYEILNLRKCLVTQRHDHFWGFEEPVDKVHCLFYDNDIIEVIKNYDEKIAENGFRFYQDYCTPDKITENLLKIFEKNL